MTTQLSSNAPTYQKALQQMVAHRTIRVTVQRTLSRYNLNTTKWIILGLVNDHPGSLRIKDVADQLQVEGPLVTSLVRQLATNGYVQTTVSVGDSRARILTLTPAGQKLIPKIEAALRQSLKPLEAGLTAGDLTVYFKCLDNFINNAAQQVP